MILVVTQHKFEVHINIWLCLIFLTKNIKSLASMDFMTVWIWSIPLDVVHGHKCKKVVSIIFLIISGSSLKRKFSEISHGAETRDNIII